MRNTFLCSMFIYGDNFSFNSSRKLTLFLKANHFVMYMPKINIRREISYLKQRKILWKENLDCKLPSLCPALLAVKTNASLQSGDSRSTDEGRPVGRSTRPAQQKTSYSIPITTSLPLTTSIKPKITSTEGNH